MIKRIFFLTLIFQSIASLSFAQVKELKTETKNNPKTETKMKVEIWSDVMCPFCYIGKRKFEAALENFPHKNKIEIVWKSFQLNPDQETNLEKDVYTYLAEVKGVSKEQSIQMHQQVAQSAKQVGLTYNFDKAVVANSYKAHQLIQLAKKYNLGDAAEENLFKAYFTDGINIADFTELEKIGVKIGLKSEEIQETLKNDSFANEIDADIYESRQLGVRGVPFFVMDRKYGVSGAQATEVFAQTLEKAYAEWAKNNPAMALETIEGAVCTPEGECK